MQGPVNPGSVDWSGENPGIYLKEREDGGWVALGVFFRVVASAYGRGIGMLVLAEPNKPAGYPDALNFCITDNQPLMAYLVANFVSKFASFRGSEALRRMTYHAATSAQTSGDAKTFYEETTAANGLAATLRWESLRAPFAVDVPPSSSATGAHQMYSVFLEAERGSISVNGKRAPGQVIQRDFLGRRMSTAFLAFSETWITPPAA
ncbi:MAG TPA: hypothetical protein VMV45_03000 [Casimicrobiaceae bacterium]|nr:hypothetical protein [Casimicrobiaceae bacterium]